MFWVKNHWLSMRRRHANLRPRQSPRDVGYDVHVNFSMAAFCSVSARVGASERGVEEAA